MAQGTSVAHFPCPGNHHRPGPILDRRPGRSSAPQAAREDPRWSGTLNCLLTTGYTELKKASSAWPAKPTVPPVTGDMLESLGFWALTQGWIGIRRPQTDPGPPPTPLCGSLNSGDGLQAAVDGFREMPNESCNPHEPRVEPASGAGSGSHPGLAGGLNTPGLCIKPRGVTLDNRVPM